MKKMVEEEEAEKENSERWLLTYSDLITLLLALFIIMYNMSNVDLEKYKALAKGFHAAFNGTTQGTGTGTGTGEGSGIGEGIGEGSASEAENSAKPETEKDSEAAAEGNGAGGALPAQPNPLDTIYKELHDYIATNDLENKIELESTSTYVRVSLKDVLLFVPDSAQMLTGSEPVLSEIRKALNSVYSKIDHITISGHTADPANDNQKSSAQAWQLSTERAVTVLNYMAAQGLPEYKLSIEGYSHFAPVAGNSTAAGRAKNRRVEITIHKAAPPDSTGTNTPAATTTSPTSSETKPTGQQASPASGQPSSTDSNKPTTTSPYSGTAEKTTASN